MGHSFAWYILEHKSVCNQWSVRDVCILLHAFRSSISIYAVQYQYGFGMYEICKLGMQYLLWFQ